jgi:hypothetical protein
VSALDLRARSASQLSDELNAARLVIPFLIHRHADGQRRIVALEVDREQLTIGRRASNDVAIPWAPVRFVTNYPWRSTPPPRLRRSATPDPLGSRARVEDAPDSPARLRELAAAIAALAQRDEEFRTELERLIGEARQAGVDVGVSQTATGDQNVQAAGLVDSEDVGREAARVRSSASSLTTPTAGPPGIGCPAAITGLVVLIGVIWIVEPLLGEPVEGLSPAERRDLALERLARGEERRLLVLDNIDSPEQLPDCLPQAGNGRVLVTSRNRAVREFAPVLPLDVFDPETAIQYLTERSERPHDRAGAERVARALGCLPLALSHAAAYCAESTSFADYLELLEALPAEDLFDTSPEASYTQTVATRVTEFLKESGDRYQKTIIFCVDQEHAARMRQALVNENKDLAYQNRRYVMRITGNDREGQDQLGNFIDPESAFPALVTTSRLLSTGVDAQTCRLIVLDRPVGSMTEFKQILGRGTRIHEDTHKYFFTLIEPRRDP